MEVKSGPAITILVCHSRFVADQLCKWDWMMVGGRWEDGATDDIFNNKVSPMTTSQQACHSIYYQYCVYVMFAKVFAFFRWVVQPRVPHLHHNHHYCHQEPKQLSESTTENKKKNNVWQ